MKHNRLNFLSGKPETLFERVTDLQEIFRQYQFGKRPCQIELEKPIVLISKADAASLSMNNIVHDSVSAVNGNSLSMSESNKGFRNGNKRVHQLVTVCLQQLLQNFYFFVSSLVIQAQEDHTMMRQTLSENLCTEILVICDDDPVLQQSLAKDGLVGDSRGFLIY